MKKTRVTFLQGDVTRAVKGAKAAGFDVGAVQIRPDGTILILSPGVEPEKTLDPLERWEADYRARKA